MSPTEIRELRGDLTRAAFARLIDVTPLTIYRWELEPDHKESRRPQKRFVSRLESFADGVLPPEEAKVEVKEPAPISKASEVLTMTERLMLLPVFDDILNGRWRSAENRLIQAMTAGILGSAAATDLIQTANALLKLLWRGDVRGAYATLGPVLRRLRSIEVSPEVGLRVYTTAALIFCSPEGRIFSPGRVNAHVARAERYSTQTEYDYRALLRCAEMWAAFHLGDSSLHERLRLRSKEDFKHANALVPRLMAWEIGSIGALLCGCVVDGIRFLKELLEEAQAHDLALIMARATGFLTYASLFAAVEIREINALLDATRRLRTKGRLEPGYHTMLLDGAQAEIHLRRAEFDEARALLTTVIEDAKSEQWPPIEIVITLNRLVYVTGDSSLSQGYFELFKEFDGSQRTTMVRASTAMFRGVELFSALDMRRAREEFTLAGRLAQEDGTLPAFHLFSFCLAYYSAVIEGDANAALSALHVLERGLEISPFVWMRGTMRLYQAVESSLEGRTDEAISHSNAAESIFKKVGDEVQLALAKRQQAATAFVTGAEDAQELLESSAAEFGRLNILIPPLYTEETIKTWKSEDVNAGAKSQTAGTSLLAGPIGRLTVRGLSSAQILEELFEILHRYWERHGNSTWSIRLEDVSGKPKLLHHYGDSPPTIVEEFGDAAGQRFKLSVNGPDDQPEVRLMLGALVRVVSLSLENAALRALTNPAASPASAPVTELPGFVAASESTKVLVQEIARLKRSRATVLIRGESGTGKEVVAHAVHRLSSRSNRAFVTFNCAAVPRDLFEGQLFGYKKGAFTGATSNHAGVIRAADGGTLFLDEIGDLPLDVQPKLLRFLENGEVFPLGDTKPTVVNVRVVAATHKDLEQMVKDGTFREDLFYRLDVVPLVLEPLRSRREDVLALSTHFLKKFTPKGQTVPRLAPDAAARLLNYDWPGNIRELRNIIERSLAFAGDAEILDVSDLRF